jgi:hypothetical protein
MSEASPSEIHLPDAVRRMIDATNAEDTPAFLATFTRDAVLNDFGREFAGLARIAEWNAQENIGTHNRITVTQGSESGGQVLIHIQVRGSGYNGGGTFTIHLADDKIVSLVIRG